MDQEKIRRAVSMILEAIGEDPTREGLQETPSRVARMYTEICAGLHQEGRDVLATRFHVDHDEVVLVKDIHFYSLCEHHLLPFFGVAHVAYLPNRGMVTGLSKLARLVEVYARRPQVQERMTNQIADILEEELSAVGTFVMVQAEHLCMSMRGIQKPGSHTVTTAARGDFNTRPELRSEILRLIQS
ncbi:MAG: GTP cyclohydrolase I FolE [Sulfobacillus acidophilus]|uniref:GTP cyclohydrolase 1 n=1 Tax=Sulfobacillus acidophilus TaxID=53633 RepID=A0A2T2WN67_9FIRM|nr:MAG: GTP cyclohydrolase I FolE [Sulfobacillus acidophilus]